MIQRLDNKPVNINDCEKVNVEILKEVFNVYVHPGWNLVKKPEAVKILTNALQLRTINVQMEIVSIQKVDTNVNVRKEPL